MGARSVAAVAILVACQACSSRPSLGDGGQLDSAGDSATDIPTDIATEPAPDLGSDAADAADGGCPGTPSYSCARPGPGSVPRTCDDVVDPQVCVNGQWTCPPFSIDYSQCECFTPAPPGCSYCKTTGLRCDGGADGPDGD